jgi:hypothetical protein
MHIYGLKKAFVKKSWQKSPKNNRITTRFLPLCNLKKGFCIAHAFGNTHQYYPIVSLEGMKTLHEYRYR